MMEFLQNPGDNQTSCNGDLKISKQPEDGGIDDCSDSIRLKIPEERVKNSSPSSGKNENLDTCVDKGVTKLEQSKEEKSLSTETSECSPSYSGATEPIDGSSPSYSGATEENLDGIASPAKSNSPDPNCAICLGKLENKSFTDSCFHQFCFTCLLEWSKIKPECPLCKQAFKSIIHNVRSIEDYDQYYITQRNADARRSWRSPEGRRFRYPSTLTNDRRRQLEFEHSIEFQNYRLTYAPHLYRGLNNRYPSMNRSTTSDARRNIYDNNYWVVPQTNGNRYREAAPEFFRENAACTHRLIPWLNRELLALLSHSENQVSFILELILALISRYDIKSSEFYEHVFPYLQDRTTHFIHEFYHFTRSPYDMLGYDRIATYELLDGSANLNRESTSTSSPDSVVEVPINNTRESNNGASRPPRPKRHFFTRHFASLDSRRRRSKTTLNRNCERFSPINYESNSRLRVYETLDLDTPGPSRQEFSLPFRPWDVTELTTANVGFGSSTQESDEECVIVDSVQPPRRTPPIITIPSSSEEDEVETEISSTPSPTDKKSGLSYEKPATRKNRCTFHYDYSSDSCSEQTDTVSSSGASNSESRKSKIKSIIGSVSANLAIPSGSSEQSSRRSHKKRKKSKKHHKHKHHRHKHGKREKE